MTNWLITGISGGFGRALAGAALARGDTVVGTTRQPDDRDFDDLAPGRAHAISLDLSDETAVRAIVAKAEALTGGIDRLVNNAGYGLFGAVEEAGMDEIRAMFEVNLFGAIRMTQAMLPAMRTRGAGHIVNITSVSGFAPWAGSAIYGASKYALECIGQTLAQEVAPFGIKVTNVAPGSFRTGFAGKGLAVTSRVIAEYADSAHLAQRSVIENAGKEKGDPERAAAAILAALDAPEPPLHLLLGEDALHYARDQFAFVESQISKWEELSLSTAYEMA
jgi:NAD(P)-dependent dehydrogenase (short-subunit alcohol dehydrogenase family)